LLCNYLRGPRLKFYSRVVRNCHCGRRATKIIASDPGRCRHREAHIKCRVWRAGSESGLFICPVLHLRQENCPRSLFCADGRTDGGVKKRVTYCRANAPLAARRAHSGKKVICMVPGVRYLTFARRALCERSEGCDSPSA
jgi:hypothetical protein